MQQDFTNWNRFCGTITAHEHDEILGCFNVNVFNFLDNVLCFTEWLQLGNSKEYLRPTSFCVLNRVTKDLAILKFVQVLDLNGQELAIGVDL